MIRVKKQENTTIFYECDCGSRGVCTFKPREGEALIVVYIECASCGETERLIISQYYADGNSPFADLNETELSWVPFINEEL